MHQRRIIYREAQLLHSVQASLLLSLLPEPLTPCWFGQEWPQVSGQSGRKALMLGLLNLESRAGCAMPHPSPRLETSLSRQKLTGVHESLGRSSPCSACCCSCGLRRTFCADQTRKCKQAPGGQPTTQGMCFTSFHHKLAFLKLPPKDLKPENLLLAEDGFMKLTDMGLAKFVLTSAPLGVLHVQKSEISRSWVKPTRRVGLPTTSLLSLLHPRGTPTLLAAQRGPYKPTEDIRWLGWSLA